ncbi:uncharacterized protein N7482_004865 [Penicillium canariense]|uniref:Uncharacterized protein n=1 Tax=Penicillium canariense TaxID=189055 RepID=A0A9W9LQH9_9EURO|nr:uncharacterized protein N7482_004865 [Penicillium canariense]KAJ5169271.1 hypothetical protein N7482_004865 [Penicillium canariense]
MSFPIDARGTNSFSINADRTPLALDESTRTLYNRAISDPSSLTDQERRLINQRPPPDEENTLCRNACGLSMDELITKAINNNNNNNINNSNDDDDDDDGLSLSSLGLSYKEASLLTAGVVEGQPGHILSEVARISPEDRDLKARAMEATRTDDIRAAREVAQRVKQRWLAVELAAAKALNDDDIRNIRFAMKVPWQEHVLQSSSNSADDSASDPASGPNDQGPGEAGGRVGLVVFFQREEEEEGGRLLEYKSQIGTALYHGLHYSPRLIKDETRDRFTLHWVAIPGIINNNLDLSALRSRFNKMLSNNEIPVGFRRDAFLYVDEEAFRSRETTRPYLWLAEPEPHSESKTETVPEPGTGTGAQPEALQPLKVDIKHIAPTLFARLVQRDLQGEARRKPYRHTSELSRLHAATNAIHIGLEERDGIWPPPARFQ